jgi:hypothetical protein
LFGAGPSAWRRRQQFPVRRARINGCKAGRPGFTDPTYQINGSYQINRLGKFAESLKSTAGGGAPSWIREGLIVCPSHVRSIEQARRDIF